MKSQNTKKLYYRDTLWFRLVIWFLLLTLIPLLMFSFIGYEKNVSSIKQAALKNLWGTSYLQENFIKNWFEHRHNDILTWSESPYTINLISSLNKTFKQKNGGLDEFVKGYASAKIINKYESNFMTLKNNYQYINDISLIDKNGNILYSLVKEEYLGKNLFSSSYNASKFSASFRKTFKDKEIHFSDLEYYESSNTKLVGFITAPIISEDGDFMGVLAVQINVDKIVSFFKSKDGFSSYLVGGDGLLRTNLSIDKKALKFKTTIADNKKNWHANGYEGVRNGKVFGVYKHINIYGVDWIIANEIESSALVKDEAKFLFILLLFLLCTTIMIYLVADFVSLQITKPLKLLVDASTTFADGSRQPIPNSKRNDEVGKLTSAFNEMIIAINNNEQLLVKKSDELQDRVTEEVAKNAAQQQKLFDQSRLAQMGEMISMIAHQWRQPLTGVGMTANNLILDIELEDIDEKRFIENLELINKQVSYLSNTIDDFKNFFKKEDKSDKFNINTLIDESYSIINSSLNSNSVEIKREYGADVTVVTYKNELMQVLLNLVKNSMDAYVENKIEDRVINISTNGDGENIEVIVKDDAGGIPDDVIGKIFDPYFSTKDKKNGTGLGLYMSKMIVEDHLGGELLVQTKDGSTKFTITLPKEMEN